MLYPLKFKSVYKDYIWGGTNLNKYKQDLPPTNIAESWEISCRPEGESIIENGIHKGMTLNQFIKTYPRGTMGTELEERYVENFPLLIKLIDADKKLSVQVHPDDVYARASGDGEYGKNEMWYVLETKPGAKLVYGIKPGTTKEEFATAVKENKVEELLNYVDVFAGDTINIPAGVVHAIGEGILLAEIQQNSNLTYRVYDYNRVDEKGNKRELHIDKALDVIDFEVVNQTKKADGLKIKTGDFATKTFLVANNYFSVEKYDVNGKVYENADGSKFYIYVVIDGECEINSKNSTERIKAGESVLVPAYTGYFTLKGRFKALKTYVPNLEKDIVKPLLDAGYSSEQVYSCVFSKTDNR